jgi:hypothetical protein
MEDLAYATTAIYLHDHSRLQRHMSSNPKDMEDLDNATTAIHENGHF